MVPLKIKTNPKVSLVFNKYPETVKPKIEQLRKLIIETASEIDEIVVIEETLKWGEPSYLVKKGSTLRIDWKPKQPTQYAMYFKCTSQLIPTFKTVFKNKFKFQGNRAIIFNLEDKIPEEELKKCIATALTYHKVKHLPLLGL
ncbi:DUF1801 domain-containing protein [Lutibacter holmesii]|uniref:DUF1801 domain-containing protein n=1 Tax=Lutibacter holmesii TaxID=1137985 RepID=A0ABW3WKF5_9FLAO